MRFFLTFLMAAAIPALAEPPTGRTCRIVFPERPNDAPQAAHLFDGKGSHQVTLPSMNLSEVIALPPGEITLRMTAEETKDPAAVPSGAPELRIPEAVKDFYILVSSDPANPTLPLKLKMVTAGDGELKPGETIWSNLTDHRIQAKLGDISLTVESGGQAVSKDPVPKSGYYKAEFTYQIDGEGDYRKITEQQWWHDAASRHVGFMVSNGGMLPKIYFYRDFRSIEAAP
jgi:hypothetical protein